MHWHDYGSAGWGMMLLIMLLSWLPIAVLAFVIARSVLDSDRVGRRSVRPRPDEILDQRLARGEIGVEEYRTLRAALDEAART